MRTFRQSRIDRSKHREKPCGLRIGSSGFSQERKKLFWYRHGLSAQNSSFPAKSTENCPTVLTFERSNLGRGKAFSHGDLRRHIYHKSYALRGVTSVFGSHRKIRRTYTIRHHLRARSAEVGDFERTVEYSTAWKVSHPVGVFLAARHTDW